MLTVGLDLSDRTARWCSLDQSGELREGVVSLTLPELTEWLSALPPATIMMEAGTNSGWIARLAGSLGHDSTIVPADILRRGRRGRRRNDRSDAYELCLLGREQHRTYTPIWQRSQELQEDLLVVRARDAAVRARSTLVNASRGLVKASGERLEVHSTESLPRFAPDELSARLHQRMAPLLDMVRDLNKGISCYDGQIQGLLARRPESERLLQVHGVGPVTTAVFMAVIGDPTRFRRSRDVAAYLGLAPGQDQSGDRDPQMGITKAGDSHCRRVLVQAAHYILGRNGKDSALRRFGLKLMGDGTSKARKRKAVIAVARKLAILLHRLWVSGETYEPLRGCAPVSTDQMEARAA